GRDTVPRLSPWSVPVPVPRKVVRLEPQQSPAGTWQITKIGRGGEPFVSSDSSGAVYVSSHLPTQVFVSRDWGSTLSFSKEFKDSLGDMVVHALPNGQMTASYMTGTDKGMRTQLTTDYGATYRQGDAPHDRPLDREWLAYDAKRDRMYMIYSDGFIGGPPSKGVFISVSKDKGMTWTETARVDNEPAGNYPVDPHLVISDDGKLYGFWTVTQDRDKIESYRCSVSVDQGATFTHHQTIADIRHDLGDRQERWMLGGMAAKGTDTVTAFYVAYRNVDFDTGSRLALSVMIRTSTDGGKTFSAPANVVNDMEAKRAAKAFDNSDRQLESGMPWIQVMPWASYDPKGKLHVMWFDNRAGVTAKLGKAASTWQLRHTVLEDGKVAGASRAVSNAFAAARPAMDFICCTTDSKYLYATWSQNVDSLRGWDFTGELWYGRMSLE
ncbi:MAG: sialidase family protein, partial [Armatimonadota bacterium]